jgi:hypothetical protein
VDGRKPGNFATVPPVFRHAKKIATAVVLGVVLLLAARNCQNELADVTIALERGDGPAIKALSAELFRADEEAPVGRFQRSIEPDAAGVIAEWTLQIDPGMYTLVVEIEPATGAPITQDYRIDAKARSRTAIDLSRAFRASP